jgi:two-component system response regulator EvgA
MKFEPSLLVIWVAPLRRKRPGSITPEIRWRHYAENEMAPICRKFTPIRVLVLSGQDPAAFAPRAMRSGAQGYVGKSQDMKEIMRGVEAVLAGYTVFPMTAGGAGMAASAVATDEEDKLRALSDKELMILQMLSKGMSNKSIGDALFMSDKTVSTYKSRIQEKLGLSSLAALIEFASLQKLTD